MSPEQQTLEAITVLSKSHPKGVTIGLVHQYLELRMARNAPTRRTVRNHIDSLCKQGLCQVASGNKGTRNVRYQPTGEVGPISLNEVGNIDLSPFELGLIQQVLEGYLPETISRRFYSKFLEPVLKSNARFKEKFRAQRSMAHVFKKERRNLLPENKARFRTTYEVIVEALETDKGITFAYQSANSGSSKEFHVDPEGVCLANQELYLIATPRDIMTPYLGIERMMNFKISRMLRPRVLPEERLAEPWFNKISEYYNGAMDIYFIQDEPPTTVVLDVFKSIAPAVMDSMPESVVTTESSTAKRDFVRLKIEGIRPNRAFAFFCIQYGARVEVIEPTPFKRLVDRIKKDPDLDKRQKPIPSRLPLEKESELVEIIESVKKWQEEMIGFLCEKFSISGIVQTIQALDREKFPFVSNDPHLIAGGLLRWNYIHFNHVHNEFLKRSQLKGVKRKRSIGFTDLRFTTDRSDEALEAFRAHLEQETSFRTRQDLKQKDLNRIRGGVLINLFGQQLYHTKLIELAEQALTALTSTNGNNREQYRSRVMEFLLDVDFRDTKYGARFLKTRFDHYLELEKEREKSQNKGAREAAKRGKLPPVARIDTEGNSDD